MKLQEAIDFIKPAIVFQESKWANIGAGSGIFTLALDQLLTKGSRIYSVDQKTTDLEQLQSQ